jgi:serine/threonine protein kinase
MYPWVSPELINLLQNLLEYNPSFRPTAHECLELKIFNKVRNKEFEQ